MDRVPNETADGRAELLERLRDLLPAAFPDGALDAGALFAALDLAEPDKPSFSFSWPGIDGARLEARVPTAATLVPDRDASVNWDITRDILIEGDNLQVVKILKASYSGNAKLIFMDPPYNTGDIFIYKNDLGVPEPQHLTAAGQANELGDATAGRVEDAGGRHAPWMNMVFPRLIASRPLLRRDGVLLVTTDDNEIHRLRLLLDLVFGESNFVGTFVWNSGRRGEAQRICGIHDYIIVYARDLQFLQDEDIRWRVRKSGLDEIYAKAEELRAEYHQDSDTIHQELLKWYGSLPEGHPSKAHELFNRVDARGVYSHEDPQNAKAYLNEHEEWAPASVFYQDYRLGIKAFNDLMGREIFDYARDTDVLGIMIEAITGDGDLVVDLFAGSGSTGHAVWKQNQADGKTRHWLLVQAPEPPDDMLKAWRRVFAAGYETVFELAADRLRRAAQQLQEGTFTGPPLGFRIFRARPTNMLIEPPTAAADSTLDEYHANTSWGRTEGESATEGADAIAFAWEVALKTGGALLDAHVKQLDIDGVIVYEFAPADNQDGDGRLFVSFDEFSLATGLELKLTDADTLVLRGDKVDDATAMVSQLPSKLTLLGRVPREASDIPDHSLCIGWTTPAATRERVVDRVPKGWYAIPDRRRDDGSHLRRVCCPGRGLLEVQLANTRHWLTRLLPGTLSWSTSLGPAPGPHLALGHPQSR